MGYLRVSLLKVCNFNCIYCRPPSFKGYRQRDFTSSEKFESAIELLCRMGIRKVRFTGGEPTLYKDLPHLVSFTKKLNGNIHTALTTNGRLLKRMAPRLAEAGLDSVNISLDTVNAAKFKFITGVDCFEKVVAGIKAAIEYIPDVKLNCVVIRDVNDEEPKELVDFANQLGIDIRFIEYMPTRHNGSANRGYVAGTVTMGRIGYEFYPVATEKESPARYYKSKALSNRVGFVNSVSQPFCTHCNRIRLAADGHLYTCLFSARAINIFELQNKSFDSEAEQIDNFVAGKQYVGCSSPPAQNQFLPAFYEIGG